MPRVCFGYLGRLFATKNSPSFGLNYKRRVMTLAILERLESSQCAVGVRPTSPDRQVIKLAGFCREHDDWLRCDLPFERYRRILTREVPPQVVYDGQGHVSPI